MGVGLCVCVCIYWVGEWVGVGVCTCGILCIAGAKQRWQFDTGMGVRNVGPGGPGQNGLFAGMGGRFCDPVPNSEEVFSKKSSSQRCTGNRACQIGLEPDEEDRP